MASLPGLWVQSKCLDQNHSSYTVAQEGCCRLLGRLVAVANTHLAATVHGGDRVEGG